MDLGRYLVEAHLREGRPVGQLAAAHGVHRSWIYKLLARHRADGDTGLTPRSRRPRSSPTAIATDVENEIVALRKHLTDDGLDAGAVTIHWHLSRNGDNAPSVSSIWRVLKRRGFVTAQPHKRPRASFIRFQAALPNECGQSDRPAPAPTIATSIARTSGPAREPGERKRPGERDGRPRERAQRGF